MHSSLSIRLQQFCHVHSKLCNKNIYVTYVIRIFLADIKRDSAQYQR